MLAPKSDYGYSRQTKTGDYVKGFKKGYADGIKVRQFYHFDIADRYYVSPFDFNYGGFQQVFKLWDFQHVFNSILTFFFRQERAQKDRPEELLRDMRRS
jgi:hypothetical protein